MEVIQIDSFRINSFVPVPTLIGISLLWTIGRHMLPLQKLTRVSYRRYLILEVILE